MTDGSCVVSPVHRLWPRGTFRKHLKVMDDFVNSFIEDALNLSPEELGKKSKSDGDYTFLHALAGYTRDRKVLRDQIVAVLLAGRVRLPPLLKLDLLVWLLPPPPELTEIL